MMKFDLPTPALQQPPTTEQMKLWKAHFDGRLIFERAPNGRLLLRETDRANRVGEG